AAKPAGGDERQLQVIAVRRTCDGGAFVLRPQHQTVPSFFRAHVWRPPTATCATSLPSAATCTGADRSIVVPSPSWPNALLPQHHRVPSFLRAHALPKSPSKAADTTSCLDVATSTTSLPRPITCPGNSDFGCEAAMPSWPNALLPQHQSEP